ncbi:MAG: NUDIX hydrolase [Clostridia bacterium]|nr:NUDIX hydrolase [Clostridia bacterium]
MVLFSGRRWVATNAIAQQKKLELAELKKAIEAYEPFNEQEASDRQLMLNLIESEPYLLTRKNSTTHFTASAWIVNEARDKVLLVWHNIYKSWSWTGGHADGDPDLRRVAEREAMEETGLKSVRLAQNEPFSLEALTVDGHEKKGSYVTSHLHLNVTYLFIADENEALSIKEDENSGVRWFSLSEAESEPCEAWMVERIYKKLNEKLQRNNNND